MWERLWCYYQWFKILGAKGIDSPAKVNQFIKTISNNHHGLINCADLLKENAKNGGQRNLIVMG